jgi:cytochrome c oxidase subunit 1
VYLTLSLFNGKKATANPWSASGLEWQTPSPPSVHNFDQVPVVVCGPYEYAIGIDQMGRGLPEPPGAEDDPASRHGKTGPSGPMHKETHVVG